MKSDPHNINQIYKETISCYNHGLLTLCAAGIRAIVEGICVSKKVKNGIDSIQKSDGSKEKKKKSNLEGKINDLFENEFLSKENAVILHTHRFLGNETLQKLSPPTKEEFVLAINIKDTILESIYELPSKAKTLNYI